MNILVIENYLEGMDYPRTADIVIAIPEGGEPICLEPPTNARVTVVRGLTAAEANALRAREHLEVRLSKREEIESEPPLDKAVRVWDGLASS